jgi:HPt (histidine-containing phosphotransfer) domain-containing protein
MPPPASSAQSAAEATRKLLASLWEKNLPVLRERLDALDTAAKAAEKSSLTSEQRHEAASTAHKLAGSLGMFGYPKGTDLARALEQKFDSSGSLEKAGLAGKVAALRGELGLVT